MWLRKVQWFRWSVMLVFLLGSSAGQSFSLFNPDRGIPPPPPPSPQPAATTKPAPPPPKPKPRPKPMPPQVDFQLFGTSRIGQQYSAILQTPKGEQVKLRWKAGEETPIPGFSGHAIRKVGYREVEITYPKHKTCRKNNPKKGVVCDPDELGARLSMHRAKPSAPKSVAPAKPETPAEIQKREEEEKKWRERYKNFKQPKEIRDADVPPGMRKVRTPFGDRLVPVQP